MTALPDTVVQSGPVASPNPVPAPIPIALETAIAAAGGFAGRASSAAEATEALRDEVAVAHDEVIGARTDVIAAKSEAVTARNEAVAARNEAVPAAAAAAAGATTATNKAGEAAGSATQADTRATAAAGSATAAAGAATTATTKAAEAAASVSSLSASISAIVAGGVAASPWWLDGFEPTVLLSAPKGAARLSGGYAADTAILTVSSASKRVVGPTGTLDTVAANALAYDYSSGRRRLLVEAKATTKYGPNSEAVGGTNYGLGTVTQGAASLGPDGTNGMREIVEASSTATAHNWWTATVVSAAAAGEHWAHQIIVRRGVGTRNLKFRDIGNAFTGSYPEVCVDLATGAVLSSANCGRVAVVAMKIAGVGTCYRVEFTATTVQAGSIGPSAYLLSGTTSGSDWYAGDGVSSVHFGYLNIEKVGSASEPPSSYVTVPSTAGVPRVADDVRLSAAALAQLALATGATIAIRGSTTYAGNGRIVGYQGNGAYSPLIMSNANASSVVAYDGTTAITAAAGSGGWGAFGAAEAHALGVVRVAVNGGAVATSAAFVAGYFAPTTARLFACGDGTNAINGFVDELAIWPLVGSAAAVAAQARVYA